ncbi:hypothetical protein CC80DRAFT_78023 [Byssothecium circinans]|uniref:G protein-coupled glucose receptor regulating Gpa2-domain-containing protein n=1 Tax=Byssothecium circinans TaxID=147558 RepID=A0A6A5TYE6_9PLEO|nr:hypothetical protein CC80DRAFT_78023 [Byssothecium circinans]
MLGLIKREPRSRARYIFTSAGTVGFLLRKVTSSPLPNIAAHSGPSSTQLFAIHRKWNVQVAAVTCAAVSMATSFIVFYWFCRMQKLFRHRLLMLLIFGDLMKASWLFLFGVVSIFRGTVYTESAFCQAAGFLVQYGTETSDYAVLVIAIHSAMQVFRPSSTIRSDGLYPYRHSLYFGAVAVPGVMSCLAFISSTWGYMSQGAFCTLPIRPFWYRLALAWIPRYLIAIVILGLAVAIYAHVGFEFRSLSDMVHNNDPSIGTTTTMLSRDPEEGTEAVLGMMEGQISPASRGSLVVPMPGTSRRASVVPSVGSILEGNDTIRSASFPSVLQALHRKSTYTLSPSQTYEPSQMLKTPSRKQSRDECTTLDGDASPLAPRSTAQVHQFARKRARIHWQLRLMFIYPIVYIVMWVFPFASHCMMYNDFWAAHPVYWLSLISTICLTSMGAVDCLIFSLRERPWRHIPSSDGTFFGSFAWWLTFSTRHNNGSISTPVVRPIETSHRAVTEANPDTPNVSTSGPGWMGNIIRAGRDVRTSGSSDHAKVQAEMARHRLGIEREERRAANNASMDTRTDLAESQREDEDDPSDTIQGRQSGVGGSVGSKARKKAGRSNIGI